jgi:hypothetical protein
LGSNFGPETDYCGGFVLSFLIGSLPYDRLYLIYAVDATDKTNGDFKGAL